MEHDLAKIIQELSSHETQLKAELEELITKTKAITGRLTQIQSAMSALRNTSQVKQNKLANMQNRKTPDQASIEEIILKILREKRSVPIVDLMQQVKSQLLAKDQSRLGFKSTFANALSSPKFKSDQSQNVFLA